MQLPAVPDYFFGLLKKGNRPVDQTISYQIGDRLFLNITNSGTLECAHCPTSSGIYEMAGYDLRLERPPTAAEIIDAVGDPTRWPEVVFCGFGEPTMRLNVLLEVAAEIKARGGRVRVNTDGLANLIHDRNVLESMAGKVDALWVSMNAQDAGTYERWCRPNLPGSYEAMLEFLREAPQYVPSVMATAIDGLEGVDISACERLAKDLGVGFCRRQCEVSC